MMYLLKPCRGGQRTLYQQFEDKTVLLEHFRKNTPLLLEMVRTDFKLRYQSSALGYLWSMLKPLFMFSVLFVVFSKFLRFGGEPLSLLLGIVVWNFFAEATNTSLRSIVSKGNLIRKIDMPKYVIVMSSVMSALINLLIALVIIIIFVMIFGGGVGISLLLLPLLVTELVAFTYGLSLFLAAVFVKVRDMNYLWDLAMQMGFYMIPIIYPLSLIQDRFENETVVNAMLINPLVQIIQDMRAIITEPGITQLYDRLSFPVTLLPFVIGSLVFVVAVRYFRKASPAFAEKV